MQLMSSYSGFIITTASIHAEALILNSSPTVLGTFASPVVRLTLLRFFEGINDSGFYTR